MDSKLSKIYQRLKEDGLTPEQEQKVLAELGDSGSHDVPDPGPPDAGEDGTLRSVRDFYAFHDLLDLQGISAMQSSSNVSIRSIDELLERDKQRAKDGFPRKINVGRLIKPGKSGKDKVVIVPSTLIPLQVSEIRF